MVEEADSIYVGVYRQVEASRQALSKTPMGWSPAAAAAGRTAQALVAQVPAGQWARPAALSTVRGSALGARATSCPHGAPGRSPKLQRDFAIPSWSCFSEIQLGLETRLI